jgi:transposase-like protein
MLETCASCKSEFLTEADPYVVRPTKDGYKLYCYCMIKGFEEVNPLKELERINADLLNTLKELTEPFTEYLNMDDLAEHNKMIREHYNLDAQ